MSADIEFGFLIRNLTSAFASKTCRNTKEADQLKLINLYRIACAAYLAPTLLTAVVTLAPGMARRMESSDNILLTAIWWWAKVQIPYVISP